MLNVNVKVEGSVEVQVHVEVQVASSRNDKRASEETRSTVTPRAG